MKEYSDQELRNLIISHYTKPQHFGSINHQDVISSKLLSPSCSDRLTLEVVINDDKIQEMKFNGEACAIATSAADILIGEVLGKTKKQALKILQNYDLLIQNNDDVDQELLNDLVAFKNVYKQKGRIVCATLASNGLKAILEKQN